jgi:hypothetical protein
MAFTRGGTHIRCSTLLTLEENPDVARAGLNPLIHFIQRGAYEGRDPSPSFNVSQYLKENPDVANARINPLVHFVRRVGEKRTLYT